MIADEELPLDTTQLEEKRKTTVNMEESSDGLHENQKHGRSYGWISTSLAIGNEQMAHSCIDPNNDDDDDNNNNNTGYFVIAENKLDFL